MLLLVLLSALMVVVCCARDWCVFVIVRSVSGIINWLLMFGLCCAYGMILFSDGWHESHRALGVKMNLSTACFVGLALAGFSKVPVAIGGPDLNPTVFLAGFVEVMALSIAEELGFGDEYPSDGARRLSLDATTRRLGSSGSSESSFCVDDHLASFSEQCDEYQAQVRATAIFATAASSAVLAIVFLILGKLELTRFASYVPMSVMEAFLSCVGYKVFKYALKFCDFEAIQFVPAGILGVTMYFIKAKHIGHPAVMIPLIMLTPLAIFYVVVFLSGHDIDWARSHGYMFPEMPDVEFWNVWTESVFKSDKINIQAWVKTLPDLITMVVVVVLDCLLKMLGTEAKLGVKVDKDKEVQLYGAANVLSLCSGGSVGYMQLKFNVINSGVMGNTVDRRAGALYALLCGAGFFGTIQLFNFMPRFFLSMLLFFAGAGFVAENLWGSRMYMNIREWLQVITILAVFILTESMLYAVMIGGLLTCFDFLVSYANVPCVLGRPLRGGELTSADRHHPIVHRALQHLTNTWCIVIRLKGFVFFGSAQKVVAYIRDLVEKEQKRPYYRRLRFVVLDCKLLDGMDASASKALKKVKDEAEDLDIRLLWSHAKGHLVADLKMRSLVESDDDWFDDLNHAILYIEGLAYTFLQHKQAQWLRVHPIFSLYQRLHHEQARLDPFQNILTMDTMRHGCPWRFCSRKTFTRKQTTLWFPGEESVNLFLVHTGAVATFHRMPGEDGSWDSPVAIYRHGWFLNGEMLVKGRTDHFAVALEDGEALCWDEEEWFKMTHEHPHMASAIARAVRVQMATDWRLFQMHAERCVPDEEELTLHPKGSDKLVPDMHMLEIPELLQNRFDAIHTAQVLEGYGLYASPVDTRDERVAPVDDTELPQLPGHVLDDLELAFNTFSITEEDICLPKSDETGDQRCIPGCKVSEALLYAGYPKLLIPPYAPKVESLTQFKDVARNAIMACLDEAQVASIRAVFDSFDNDGSGAFDIAELRLVLQKTFHPLISIEESVCISHAWDIDRSGNMDLVEFTQLVSRFTRLYEQEWCFTLALKELLNKETVLEKDVVTGQDLRERSHTWFSDDAHEEMMWAADWLSGGEGRGEKIGAWNIISMLLMDLAPVKGRLPPEAKTDIVVGSKQAVSEPLDAENMDNLVRSLAASGVTVMSRQVSPPVPLDRTVSPHDLRIKYIRDEMLEQEGKMRMTEVADDGRESHLLCLKASNSVAALADLCEGDSTQPMPVRVSEALTDPKRSTHSFVWFVFTMAVLACSLVALVVQPMLDSADADVVWVLIEVTFTVVFCFELGVRLWGALTLGRTLKEFLSNVSNFCDVVAVLPFFMELISVESHAFDIVRIVRLVKVTRAISVIRAQAEGFVSAIIVVLAVIWGIYLKNK